MGHQSKVCEVCEMPHESKTHHKNWSRRTLDPLLTLAASWLGHREQDKSHVCPLPTSHQDTSLELQMVLYRVLAGTKTKMHLSPWLKRPKNKNHNACPSAPGCYQKLHTRSYFSMLVMRLYHKTNQRRSLYLSGAGEGLSAGLEFLHARHKHFFWSVMGQACLSLTLQSSDSQEPQNVWGLDFGHDSHTVCRGACGHVIQVLGWILLPQLGSPCTSLPCDWCCGREPASKLNVICTGAADLLNSQVKSLRTRGARFHFIWGLAGVRPQDTVSSVWKRWCRSSAIHWFGSGGRETLWNGVQQTGTHQYLLYGCGIGCATILPYLEDLWNPNQHAILRLKEFSIQRNIIDKLLQRRRKRLRWWPSTPFAWIAWWLLDSHSQYTEKVYKTDNGLSMEEQSTILTWVLFW